MIRLKFWGVRGSTPTPQIENLGYGGNTSCLELRLEDNQSIIFDAGSGLRNLGSTLLKEANGANLDLKVFLTHFHWDHIQGIPFFAPLFLSGQPRHVSLALQRQPGRDSGRSDGAAVFPHRPGVGGGEARVRRTRFAGRRVSPGSPSGRFR